MFSFFFRILFLSPFSLILVLPVHSWSALPFPGKREQNPEKEFLELYNSDQFVNKLKAIQILTNAKTPSAIKLLISRVFQKEEDPLLLLEAIQGLKNVGSNRCHFVLFKALAGASTPELRHHLLEILGGIDNPQSSSILIEHTRHPDSRDRTIALLSLTKHKSNSWPEVFRQALLDPAWQVRTVAIQGLAGSKNDEINIAALIDAMNREEGRLREEIYHTLKSLTRRDLGPSAIQWKRWWDVYSNKTKEEKKQAELSNPDRFYAPSYYGIRFQSKRVVFLIDVSGSMNGGISVSERQVLEILGKNFAPNQTLQTKLDLAKLALVKVLNEMDPDSLFNIIFYESSATAWGKRLLKLQEDVRKKAVTRIINLSPSGATNIWDALEASLQIMGNSFKENYEKGPDTFFLLTDGYPTAGTVANSPAILAHFQLVNRVRQIRVHTVGMGVHDREFLQSISETSGGTYRGF